MRAGSAILTINGTNLLPKSCFKIARFKEISHNFNVLKFSSEKIVSLPKQRTKHTPTTKANDGSPVSGDMHR